MSVAINAGLISTILRIFTKFNCIPYAFLDIAASVESSLMNSESKTFSAIKRKRASIRAELERVEQVALKDEKIISACSRIRRALHQAAPAVDSCSRCGVELRQGRIHRCIVCKAIYCSVKCQDASWKHGHMKECTARRKGTE